MEQGEKSNTQLNVTELIKEGLMIEIDNKVEFAGRNKNEKDDTKNNVTTTEAQKIIDDDKEGAEKDDILDIDFTTNEEIEKIKIGDKVEIIGYVDEVEACHMAGDYLLFKFILNNNNGKRLQVVAWEDQAERTEAQVSIYQIIYLDKAKAKIIDGYTEGNLKNFEISIKDTTIIQGLGIMKKKHIRVITSYDSTVQHPLVQLNQTQGNLLPTILRTCGYLKTAFFVKNTGTSTKSEAIGYITDGNLKLELKILNYSKNVFHQGDHIEVVGFPVVRDNYLILNVESVHEIRRMSEAIKPLKWLLKGKYFIDVPEYNKRQKLN